MKKITLLVAVTFLISSISWSEEPHKHMMNNEKMMMRPEKPDKRSERIRLSENMSSLLNNVLNENDSLRELLFKRESKGYSRRVNSFVKALKEAREKNDIKDISQKNRLNSMLSATEELLTMMKMVSGDDRKNVYGQISDKLSEIVKTFDVNSSYHVFFCPMEKKFWVAKGKKVENPYLPEKMSNCGELKF